VVQADDHVAGADAGTRGGRIVHRRDNLDEAVLDAHFHAEAAELTSGAFLQAVVVIGSQIGGVWVDAGQHALDGVFQQGAVVDLFHIGAADLVQHLGEDAHLVDGQGQVTRRAGRDFARQNGFNGRQWRGAVDPNACRYGGQVLCRMESGTAKGEAEDKNGKGT